MARPRTSVLITDRILVDVFALSLYTRPLIPSVIQGPLFRVDSVGLWGLYEAERLQMSLEVNESPSDQLE